jgi:hypothetical protein
MHPAQDLWNRHHPPQGYPDGVVEVPEAISGLAFFPGGYGLYGAQKGRALPEFPKGGIMVLGHDFHSKAGYDESRCRGGERVEMPTWRNLLELFDAVGVPLGRCFFTNLYMGLRQGTATTGRFPGARDAAFVMHCKAFLLEQIRAQRPTLVLTLGVNVPPVLGALSPELASWARKRGLKHLDAAGPVKKGVTFTGVDDFRTTVVALIHPCMRHGSLRHRRYGGKEGADAELAMLREGLAEARVRSALTMG